MGTYMYLYSGGEPLVRKADIIRLCEAHPDCEFLAFTNGTLIDEEFADEMLRVKNFVPAISVEGFEEAADFHRGDDLSFALAGWAECFVVRAGHRHRPGAVCRLHRALPVCVAAPFDLPYRAAAVSPVQMAGAGRLVRGRDGRAALSPLVRALLRQGARDVCLADLSLLHLRAAVVLQPCPALRRKNMEARSSSGAGRKKVIKSDQ